MLTATLTAAGLTALSWLLTGLVTLSILARLLTIGLLTILPGLLSRLAGLLPLLSRLLSFLTGLLPLPPTPLSAGPLTLRGRELVVLRLTILLLFAVGALLLIATARHCILRGRRTASGLPASAGLSRRTAGVGLLVAIRIDAQFLR